MTKEEFKERWESDTNGGGITFDDIAKCASEWGICPTPRVRPMNEVQYRVLVAAGVDDSEEFHP